MRESEAQRSVLHRIPVRWKLPVALAIVVATAVMPRRPDWIYLAPACVTLCLWLLSRMPLMFALKRLLVAELFIVGMALLVLIHPSALPVFLSAVIKSNLCVLTMLLLAYTTPFHEILAELRRVRFPAIMLTTIALLVRYLPVLHSESRRMQRARASRTFRRAKQTEWRGLSNIAAQLFIRSANRAERIYMAMCARGWR